MRSANQGVSTLRSWTLLSTAFLVAGCQVVGSQLLSQNASERTEAKAFGGRVQQGGTYYLPYGLVNFTVKSDNDGKFIEASDFANPVVLPDHGLEFQLNVAVKASHDESVTVDYSEGMLDKIMVTSQGQQAEILNNLAEIFFVLQSGDPDGFKDIFKASGTRPAGQGVKTLLTYPVNPLSDRSVTKLNNALRLNGHAYCVLVDNIEGDAIAGSCPGRHRQVSSPMSQWETFARSNPEVAEGIYFRRAETYLLSILSNIGDGSKTSDWRTVDRIPIELPAVEKIYRMDIRRSAFAERKTTIDFEKGMLTQVDVEKGSEIEAAINVPLKVAKAIVSLPSVTIAQQFRNVDNEIKLIDSRTLLINAENDLLAEARKVQDGAKE